MCLKVFTDVKNVLKHKKLTKVIKVSSLLDVVSSYLGFKKKKKNWRLFLLKQ